jgi:hypothetical protein
MEGYEPCIFWPKLTGVGIKRAAARTPHMMMGNKSNDAIFDSLEKEFVSAIVRSLRKIRHTNPSLGSS